MSLPPDAIEHPEALAEGLAIARSGSWPHKKALGEFNRALNYLFDGPGDPAYLGASLKVDDLFYEHPTLAGGVRVFSRWFWGDGRAGVVAVIYVKVDRPVWMSIVANASHVDESEAESTALNGAHSRLSDL